MTKDRISELMNLMKGYNDVQVGQDDVTSDTRESVPEETSRSITTFLEQVQSCRDEIKSMRDQIDILKRYHRDIQRSLNDSTRKELERKVEDKKAIITSAIMTIRNNIKSIQEIFVVKKASPAMVRMREVQINSLVRSINDVTEQYYNCLVDHSQKCKKLLYDMISIVDDNESNFEELIQQGKVAFFVNNLLLNELEQKINFRAVEDRHADIIKVEKSIEELKNLTQDLWLVVAIQSERVEYVEQYVQKTAKKVDDAAKTIDHASKLRNKTRKRKLLIALLCFFIILTVLVIVTFL
ncbi:UNVERIFIED_CONTAM: hypothetical protein PYX00_005545 [Menopon gallinae]|uniref:t-SNARE coiled-coil homology domain-containing protein n=1 Tax=Menopon gallinae TaxID=328185 RepID=A0AAW2HST8_9NEOP